MLNLTEEQILAAYRLWKDNLISKEVFYETLNKIKGNTNPTSNTNPTNTITPEQIKYIKNLITDGKIPNTQTLDLTKTEAQILIHNAINQVPKDMKELYEDTGDY
jgi:hypothetical protein